MKHIVGITFKVPATLDDLYFDFVAQSTLYLYLLLDKLEDVEPILLCDKHVIPNNPLFQTNKHTHLLMGSKKYEDEKHRFQTVIQVGYPFSMVDLSFFKEIGARRIIYHTRNEYMREMEENLFSHRDSGYPQYAQFKKDQYFEEVWITPAVEHANLHYFETRYRCPVRVMPLLWSPILLEHFAISFPNKGIYTPRKTHGRILILNTNEVFGEYALPALFVCESAYREVEDKDAINKVMVTHMDNLNTLQFSRFTYSLDLYRDKKITIEKEMNAVKMISTYADMAVFHQWDSPFQFFYLELAWMGWAFLHNSPLLPNLGYAYDKFKYKQGGEVLQYILKTHEKVYLNYFITQRKLIQEHFSIDNPKIQSIYRAQLLHR